MPRWVSLPCHRLQQIHRSSGRSAAPLHGSEVFIGDLGHQLLVPVSFNFSQRQLVGETALHVSLSQFPKTGAPAETRPATLMEIPTMISCSA